MRTDQSNGVTATDSTLVLDGDRAIELPAIWLRANCPCGSCMDVRNGQRYFNITDIPERPRIRAVVPDGEGVTITFEPDGHEATFPYSWLLGDGPTATERAQGRGEDSKRLWTAPELEGEQLRVDWTEYQRDPRVRYRALAQVVELGFVILEGVPSSEGQVLDVARDFGHVRVTNYGSLFDVRVEATPENLAFTGRAISPHTDNPYRDPTPTMQLLHCLVNEVEGGESGLVDGFNAAAILRREDPRAFQTLARTQVTFSYSSPNAELSATRPMIQIDEDGRVRAIHFNNRSMQPPRLPADDIPEFYRSYRAFAEVLVRPELQVDFKLAAGDCLVFDNVRLLHARTGFEDSGGRHLQGCYADLDALGSTVALLAREGVAQ